MPRLLPLFALAFAATGALAEPARMPALGAASNFGQSWDPALLDAAQAAGIGALRDEIHWDAVEQGGGLHFGTFLTRYPEMLAARGIGLTLIAGGGHPEHDHGDTPYTPDAIAAFAGFAAGAAARFAAVGAVEVGNEANSESFTVGPAYGADIGERAAHYAELLAATHDAVRAVRPDVAVIGGAAHSIPLAWFEALSALGAADKMDAVALHPYTTPPEQFRRQVALLRAVPGFETLPIAVTEIGTEEAARAPALLMKSACQMALAGVTQLDWYPLGARGDGYVPLIAPDGSLTDVGRTWQLLQTELAGRAVVDAAPDPFTYACRFGDRGLVIWGAARDVSLAPGLAAFDATGAPVAAPRLDRAAPLLIFSDGPAPVPGDTVTLGPQAVLADSFDQFAYPGQAGGGFDRFARVAGRRVPFELGLGQETGGVPWTPYLRSARDGMLRMDARFLLPSIWEEGPVEIVHAWRAPADMVVAVTAYVAPEAASRDGVVVTVRRNGETLDARTLTAPETITLPRVALAKGDLLEIAVGPGASAEGDASAYRFTLRRAE